MSTSVPQERHYVAPLIRNRETGEGVQVKTLRNIHLAIMDFMLANPGIPQWAVANHFGKTQSWLSTIVNSDLFQLHYHERRRLIEDDQRRAINSKIFEMADKGLTKLIAGLDDDEVSVSEKRAITRLALEAQGALAHGSKAPAVVVNNNTKKEKKKEEIDPLKVEFEAFWKSYPNKQGKLRAEDYYREWRKTKSAEELSSSLAAYVLAKRKARNDTFSNGSTFLNPRPRGDSANISDFFQSSFFCGKCLCRNLDNGLCSVTMERVRADAVACERYERDTNG